MIWMIHRGLVWEECRNCFTNKKLNVEYRDDLKKNVCIDQFVDVFMICYHEQNTKLFGTIADFLIPFSLDINLV